MDDQEAQQPYTPEEEEQLKRIEEELERAKAVEFASPAGDRGLEVKLDELQARARAARHNLEKHTPEGSQGSFVTPDSGRSLGLGLQIAYAILGVPLVGFGVGWLIDQAVGGVFWRGILTIVGATAAVWYAIRSTNRQ